MKLLWDFTGDSMLSRSMNGSPADWKVHISRNSPARNSNRRDGVESCGILLKSRSILEVILRKLYLTLPPYMTLRAPRPDLRYWRTWSGGSSDGRSYRWLSSCLCEPLLRAQIQGVASWIEKRDPLLE